MTPDVMNFIAKHKGKLQGKVLEIGSYNVNGGVRGIVPIAVGTDLRAGPGVDLVAPVEKLLDYFQEGEFDAIVSTETLEHVEDWKVFVNVSWALVKENGWIVMTMASKAKGRHAYPDDYWRFDLNQIQEIWPGAHVENAGRISIAWAKQKTGELGDLDKVVPYKVP